MFDLKQEAEEIAYLQTQVSFLAGSKVVRDRRGHSRVPCFTLQKGKEKFFAKLYPGYRERSLQDIDRKYDQLNIPTPRIIHLTYLPSIDKTFCVYGYIEGATFAELLPKLSIAEIEQLGRKVGRELKKFVHEQGNQQEFQEKFDVEILALVKNMYLQRSICYQHNYELSKIDLGRFEKSLQNLKQVIYQIPPNFAHTDINLTNIIFNKDRPILVDTDGSKMVFRALDFRGIVWWCWNSEMTVTEKEREAAAYRGIFQGMFDDKIPHSFHQELSFTMMYEFLIRLQKYAGDNEQTCYSFMRWYENLKQTEYFERYKFPWFQ